MFPNIFSAATSLPVRTTLIYTTSIQDDKWKNQFAEKLSGGQRRLLAFVQVLIGQPDIIFLDEPTAGMDTSTRIRFWEIVRDLKKAGKTIIYSSHYIEEVEHTADRILVLHQGQLLRDTTPYLMRSEEKVKVFTLPVDYLPFFEDLEIEDLQSKADTVSFSSKKPQMIWDLLVEAHCPIEDIEMTNKETYHENISSDFKTRVLNQQAVNFQFTDGHRYACCFFLTLHYYLGQ